MSHRTALWVTGFFHLLCAANTLLFQKLQRFFKVCAQLRKFLPQKGGRQVGSSVDLPKLQTWTVGILVSHFTGIQTILGSERLSDRAHEFKRSCFGHELNYCQPVQLVRGGCDLDVISLPAWHKGSSATWFKLLFAQIIPNPKGSHKKFPIWNFNSRASRSWRLLKKMAIPPEIRLAKLGTAGPGRQLELPQQLSQAGHPGLV